MPAACVLLPVSRGRFPALASTLHERRTKSVSTLYEPAMSDLIKVSDAIAEFLKRKEIRHVFGIIGSANAHIFDSIQNLGYTEIVCVHHEQAATMAMQTYYRVHGRMSAALVTAGGASANAITGVLSAWADSIPGMVISGQENTRFINRMRPMRMWGIQGYDSAGMVAGITKYAARVMEPSQAVLELERAHAIAAAGRPGPVWVDFPMDVQGSRVATADWARWDPSSVVDDRPAPSIVQVDAVEALIRAATRPVFWLGHGIRLAGAVDAIEPLLECCPLPTLLSWAGLDMLPAAHPLNAGRAGVYGDRAANLIVQNADLVVAIGNRMAIPMIGYEHAEFARGARIVQVDLDPLELDKVADIVDISIEADAGRFMTALTERFRARPLDTRRAASGADGAGSVGITGSVGGAAQASSPVVATDPALAHAAKRTLAAARPSSPVVDIATWTATCTAWRERYPLVGREHADAPGFINSYRFIDRLCNHLKPDQVVVTDMGTALLSGHEAMRLAPGQRMMTSTGLGEMGYGLPAAIGVSFARDRGEVLCLNCDGGMMMNLQELQTIAHHRLPVKLIIFNNDGYLMIKHTQKNLFSGRYTGVNASSGVTCPDFGKIATAFEIPYCSIRSWEDFDASIGALQAASGPMICDVFMDPEQFFHPKLSVAVDRSGRLVSPPLEDLSPLLPRDELRENMIIDLHPKSVGL